MKYKFVKDIKLIEQKLRTEQVEMKKKGVKYLSEEKALAKYL